jgi:hypothetical protein
MKQTALYIGIEQLEQAKALAKQDGVTVSEVLRRALDVYLMLKGEKLTVSKHFKKGE